MNKYLVHIILATRLQGFNIQSKQVEKTLKSDHQKWTSMYQVIFVTAYKKAPTTWSISQISMQKTLFYIDNTTSALMIILFSINFSWKFALSYVRCAVISNHKLRTPKQQPRFGITGNRPVYPPFHLSVLWAEVVSNPRCLSVIHTLHFSLLYSYPTQCFRQLYSQLIFTQTKIVTNEGTIASSSSAIAFC